ncbi:MAG: hypothetical protein ACTSO3_11305 [Candidatus Heimdallarchaeaceae archaeon]
MTSVQVALKVAITLMTISFFGALTIALVKPEWIMPLIYIKLGLIGCTVLFFLGKTFIPKIVSRSRTG